MGKRGVFVFFILLLSVFIISLTSAGIGDFFNRITGRATDDPADFLVIISLTLYNADTETAIDTLSDGYVINFAKIGKNLSVVANAKSDVKSVVFSYDSNSKYQIESSKPYAIRGDNNGNLNPWTPTLGVHTLNVTPYNQSSGTGIKGIPYSIKFSVVDISSACTDSDGGKNYDVKGTITLDNGDVKTDSCSDYKLLNEYYCNNNVGSLETYNCPYQCSDGKCVAQSNSGTGTGLNGSYYDNIDFTNLKLNRIDPTINFDWRQNAPHSSMGNDTFSIRWEGMVEAQYTETYTFYELSNNGARVYINNQLVVNDWASHSSREAKGSINLQAGVKYPIKVEYYEDDNNAVIKLYWSSPSQSKEIIPQTQLYPILSVTAPPLATCRDNDGGLKYYKKGGTCVGTDCKYDYCFSNGISLKEYYCLAVDDRSSVDYQCSTGCKNGACVTQPLNGSLKFVLYSGSPGFPMNNGYVYLYNLNNEYVDGRSTVRNYSFFANVPVGKYRAVATAPGYFNITMNVNVTFNKTTTYSFYMKDDPAYLISSSVATLKDSYKVGEQINLTDPPEEVESSNFISGNVVEDNGEAVDNNLDNRLKDSVYRRDIEGSLRVKSNVEEIEKSRGYIIKLKEEPLAVKKRKLDESKEVKKKVGVASEVVSHKSKIENEHRAAKKKIREAIGKARQKSITGNVIEESEKFNLIEWIKKLFRGRISGYAISEEELDKEILAEYDTVFNGIALDITEEEAREIEKLKEVEAVYSNVKVNITLMDSVPLINADDVWSRKDTNGLNLTGKGVKIAIIDTGVDYTHPDLGCNNDNRCGNVTWPYRLNRPRIYKNRVVWVDKRNLEYDIYLYDLVTKKETLITDESSLFNVDCSGDSIYPDIYEDKIVYNECPGGNIYLYDIATDKETVIDNNGASLSYPRIDRNRVVWRGQDSSLYLYEISTGKKTVIAIWNSILYSPPSYPSIYGDNVVYYSSEESGGKYIYLYNILSGKTTRITNDLAHPGRHTSIYGDKIVWSDSRNDKVDIYMYDLTTRKEVLIYPGKDSEVGDPRDELEIYGNKIVERKIFLSDNTRYAIWKVFVYDILTGKETDIATADIDYFYDLYPNIYENKIVWAGKDKSDNGWEIYLYDISTGLITQATPSHVTNLEGLFPNLKIVDGYDFSGNSEAEDFNIIPDNDPIDYYGHGTHVASIAAGNGVLKGVAPDAQIVAYKVFPNSDSSVIMSAIERAVDPNEDDNFNDKVDIISMSLGANCWGDYGEDCGPDDPVSQSIDNAVDAGIVVVVSAGNSGSEEGTIGSPGTARKAITVGASYKKDYIGNYWGDLDPKTDQVTLFSSRGPVVWTDSSGVQQTIIKPDIVAPGAIICAARYDSIFPEGQHTYYYPCLDDKHVQIAGTSMSAPIVAGAVALIKQAHPDWTPLQIKDKIKETAKDLGYDENVQGAGRIDIDKALRPQSKIVNNGLLAVNGTLTMTLQRFENNAWATESSVVKKSLSLKAKEVVKLDKLWNPLNVRASRTGKYRVRVEFKPLAGGISSAIWEFNVV